MSIVKEKFGSLSLDLISLQNCVQKLWNCAGVRRQNKVASIRNSGWFVIWLTSHFFSLCVMNARQKSLKNFDDPILSKATTYFNSLAQFPTHSSVRRDVKGLLDYLALKPVENSRYTGDMLSNFQKTHQRPIDFEEKLFGFGAPSMKNWKRNLNKSGLIAKYS